MPKEHIGQPAIIKKEDATLIVNTSLVLIIMFILGTIILNAYTYILFKEKKRLRKKKKKVKIKKKR